jgi:hypothetical protein
MADAVRKNTVIYVKPEVTEGTYVPPAAGGDAVQTLADGLEMSPTKELIDRNIARGGIGRVAGRPGQESVTATIPVECKAGSTTGSAPEYGVLMKAALGGVRTVASAVTASTADGATGTAARVPLANADKNKYALNDIVRVRRVAGDHIGRVLAVSNVDGSVSITLEPALASGTFGSGDVVAAVTTYLTTDTGHESVSISKEMEGVTTERGIGCRVTSLSLNNFSTGQIADFSFGLEGLSFERVLSASGFTPSFDTSEPPLILGAKVFMDGTEVLVNEVSLSVENTVAFKTATGAPKGKISSRITERVVSGSFNPYKQSDSMDFYTRFNATTKFGLLLYAYNPGAGANQKEQIVAVYVPNCLITELGESDQDGLLQENVSFQADGSEMYVSFI